MMDSKTPEHYHFMSTFPHLSLWEVAHRWANQDPGQTNPTSLPLLVQDILLRLMDAQRRHDLSVCSPRGTVLKDWNYIPHWKQYVPVQNDWDESEEHRRELYYEYMDKVVEPHDQLINRHDEMIESRSFDKEYLNTVRVDQGDLFEWCFKECIPVPRFWISPESEEEHKREYEYRKLISDRVREFEAGGEEITEEQYDEIIKSVRSGDQDSETLKPPKTGKMTQSEVDGFWEALMDQQKTRLLCRELASALWKYHPDMTIAEIEKHELISKYAGGLAYSGRSTIRNWIKDLDPRPLEQRTGRPKNK